MVKHHISPLNGLFFHRTNPSFSPGPAGVRPQDGSVVHQRQGLEGNLGQQLGEDPRDCLGEQGPQAAWQGSHQSHPPK